MFPVRYVHAADLHLDAAFRGISREASGSDMAARLRAATFTALERLFALCEKEKPDFLVIAGDIYNQEDRSLKAQMALRDGCERLGACGIRVFLAHGNHDPLPSRLQTLRWPDNTVIFGDSAESHIVTRDGAPVAVVHGISHATTHESRNLAQSFSRQDMRSHEGDGGTHCFQLGVLHCTLEGIQHLDRYAPCTLDDLTATGLDAWALGHVHERRVMSSSPFVAYPGNMQGLHINEPGSRGCLLVTALPGKPVPSSAAEKDGCAFAISSTFHPLGPVQWECLEVHLDGISQVDRLENAIMVAMERARAATDVSCQLLITRARLTGRTDLDSLLRSPDTTAELADRLRVAAEGNPLVWLKDIAVATGQPLDMEALAQREDLLGETLRLARSAVDPATPEALRILAEDALHPLFRHPKARKALAAPDDQDLNVLLDEAQRLCIDYMEAR